MEKVMSFKEKVQAMTAKEIIMAMVEGLQNPVIAVNMDTFGMIENNICYGCAATNTVCKISGKVFDAESIDWRGARAELVQSRIDFLRHFEAAIDSLRKGYIWAYNGRAEEIGVAQINFNYETDLPYLDNNYTPEDLQAYINLANAQKQIS